ncbi:MAG: SDR family NAD(P)-dependent oxidoreductase, partial [Roseinatronobacter sp.]
DVMTGSGKFCLLTGASHGLGLALAQELVARGYQVLGTGRRPHAELPADFPDCAYLPVDLTQADAAPRIAAWCAQQVAGPLPLAILNAGAGRYRPLSDETAAEMAAVLQINFDANVQLAQALHPKLQGGTLGLIGSVAHKGAAGMPVYAASKGALDGFGRALAEEWRGTVRVRVLHPGPVATGMSERAGRPRDMIDSLFLSPRAVAMTLLDRLNSTRGPDRQVVSFAQVGGHMLWRKLARGAGR